jgi:RimJ/RimL family protein N-acetyltransferase
MTTPDHLTLEEGYAAYRPVGKAAPPQAIDELIAALTWCRQAGIARLMCDARGWSAIDGMDTSERFQLGKRAADVARGHVKVAMVLTRTQVDPERFGETVARNRGLDVEIFFNEVEALTWVAGPDAIRPVLATERLSLRWLVPSDAPFILELTTQPSWMRNIGDRGVRDLPTAEGYIRNGPLASYAAKGFGLWCVVRTTDNVPVGMCGFIKRDSMDDPELAYAYLERYHGMGYGSEAAVATMAYGRRTLGLQRIAAIVDPTNTASIKILERVGMTYRGPIQMPGDPAPISHFTT